MKLPKMPYNDFQIITHPMEWNLMIAELMTHPYWGVFLHYKDGKC